MERVLDWTSFWFEEVELSKMNTPSADSLTLFILVAAMLVYRTVDLVSTKEKLEQVALRTNWWTGKFTFAVLRGALRHCKRDARVLLPRISLLMRIREEFVAGLMLLYLFLFMIVGLCVLLSEGVRTGAKVTLVVAIVTAIISLISSIINLLIEKVKTCV